MNSNMYKFLATVQHQMHKHKKAVALGMAVASFTEAHAQVAAGTTGMCAIASWLKSIAGIVALIAIGILGINSFFGKSELVADIVTKVLIGASIIGAGAWFVSQTGLTATCVVPTV